uniref:Cell division protein FtsX n=1 Tax=candidate division WOR-3 bacterium TaxID=2052148 RepID=A0A7C3YPW6_UNCW3
MGLKFIWRETIRTIKFSLLNFFLSALVQALSLLLLLIFLTITFNLFSLIKETYNRIEIYAFLEENVPYPEVADKIFLIAGVKEIRYVSKDEALEELKEDLGEDASLLSGLDKNPLPNTIRIKLEPNYHSASALKEIEKKLTNIPGIREVWSGREVLGKLEKLLRVIIFSDIGILIIVGISVIFIVLQNIEASTFQRRREIEIMRLVGATEYLVSAPFYFQGLLQGIIGGIFAFLGVSLLAYFVSATLISFSFPSLPFFLLSLTVGAVLGISGSYVALSRIKETEK